MDDIKHKMYTGVSNEKILYNIKRLNEINDNVVVRIPLIEGVNADKENILKTAKYVKTNIKNPKIELLPYHNFGDEKYDALGIERPSKDFKIPSVELVKELKRLIEIEAVEVVSYR